MAISDVLEKIGQGVKTAGRAAVPVLERTAEVVSGEAPEIDAEKRKQQYALEDQQIATKASLLENQLSMGQKYGTLTPQQQQQYVDQISQLYSHPRHAGTLMEKLRKAIHPDGAYAQGPQAALPNATPEGGTGLADEKLATQKRGVHPVPGVKPFKGPDGLYYQPMYDAQGKIVNEQIEGYNPPPVKSGGKSPPLSGNMLPSDAVGPNGEPISEADRSAAKSFVEFGGAWWPVAKRKPVMRQEGNDLLLIDADSGSVIRKIASAGAKVTTRQTLQPGDDGQMHMVNLTSVTTPEGATIDVDQGETPQQSPSGSQSSTPKPKGVSSVLPKKSSTGAKPVSSSASPGPVVPGLTTLANSKNPLYKANIGTYKKANDDVIAATKMSSLADQVASHPNDAINQKRLAVALERASAGRFTTQALNYIITAGWGNTIEQWANNPTTGALPADVLRQLVDGAHQNLQAAQDALKTASSPLGQTPAPPPPSTVDPDIKAIVDGLKAKKTP